MSIATLVMPADHESLRRLGPWLTELLGEPLPGDVPGLLSRIELALHEVCVNVVDHAYGGGPGELTVTGRADDTTVELTVTDTGCAFERHAVVAPRAGVPQIRGYGLMIVNQLVDQVDYDRVDATNICTLRISRRAPDPAG
ncbi:ATP-binding protein [Actinoplanes sp. NPDC049548]|uniref:ATP-binding protein n=1 Tax=Actinoplanes sp. NPDC049548 TaxID=3155152 RepID=UPI003420F65C